MEEDKLDPEVAQRVHDLLRQRELWVSFQPILVFLDASVLMAASRSLTCGSAVAMEVCQGSRFRAALSIMVLLEACRNIAEKFEERELLRF